MAASVCRVGSTVGRALAKTHRVSISLKVVQNTLLKNVEYIGGMFRNTKSVLVRASQEAS